VGEALIELSVIIPTYNRAARVVAAVQSLARQAADGPFFEVIVVIDGSTDDTADRLAALSVPFPLAVLRQENRGQNVARNRGAAAARGRTLVFIDDDMIAAPGLVAEHHRVQRVAERVVGIGQIRSELASGADWFARRFAEAWRGHYEELNRGGREPTWAECYGGNLAIGRETFLAAGGFAEDVRRSHDIELGFRLAGCGATFTYVPDAETVQDERKGVEELAADFQSAGAAYVTLVRRHPAMAPVLLGPLAEVRPRDALLRHVLASLRLPPRLLGGLGPLMRNAQRREWWFQFLLDFFYWKGVRTAARDDAEAAGLLRRTPILMYHAFTGERRGSQFVVPALTFARQMAWLRRLGFEVLGLEEFLRLRREHRPLPRRAVVITIDDAYADTLEHAVPVLRRHGYPATIFVVTERVGDANTWSNGALKGRPLLGWRDLAALVAAGIELGAHTETHPVLPALDAAGVRREVTRSKQTLESRLGRPVHAFAYPYGEHAAAVERIVQEAGFWGACSVNPGLNTIGTPEYALRRIEVEGALPLHRFILALFMGDIRVRAR
jgi:peptidoglycan/xylan/chitin deacetylase (PgdA/CDA1 family)/GT2 family glycosyltransferase